MSEHQVVEPELIQKIHAQALEFIDSQGVRRIVENEETPGDPYRFGFTMERGARTIVGLSEVEADFASAAAQYVIVLAQQIVTLADQIDRIHRGIEEATSEVGKAVDGDG